jgi:choice-of-anchor A domain-containing protein
MTATPGSGADGVTVVQINGNFNLNGNSLILSGTPSDVFVVNVSGTLILVGTGELSLTGGVTANRVLCNFTGASGSISAQVGNVLAGTLLAPNYSVSSGDDSFSGEIIASGSIQLLSASKVNAGSKISNTATVTDTTTRP